MVHSLTNQIRSQMTSNEFVRKLSELCHERSTFRGSSPLLTAIRLYERGDHDMLAFSYVAYRTDGQYRSPDEWQEAAVSLNISPKDACEIAADYIMDCDQQLRAQLLGATTLED